MENISTPLYLQVGKSTWGATLDVDLELVLHTLVYILAGLTVWLGDRGKELIHIKEKVSYCKSGKRVFRTVVFGAGSLVRTFLLFLDKQSARETKYGFKCSVTPNTERTKVGDMLEHINSLMHGKNSCIGLRG